MEIVKAPYWGHTYNTLNEKQKIVCWTVIIPLVDMSHRSVFEYAFRNVQ